MVHDKIRAAARKRMAQTGERKHSPRLTVSDGGAVLAGVLRGNRLGWGQPGVSGHELVQDFVGGEAVLAGGVDVAADVEAVLGDVVAGEAAGDLLLGFQRADAALGLMPRAA
jgi:hypothetical protein